MIWVRKLGDRDTENDKRNWQHIYFHHVFHHRVLVQMNSSFQVNTHKQLRLILLVLTIRQIVFALRAECSSDISSMLMTTRVDKHKANKIICMDNVCVV